jgi:hypothetical protein
MIIPTPYGAAASSRLAAVPGPPSDLESLYDEVTVARLTRLDPADQRRERVRVAGAGWRSGGAGGALVAALALGLQEVLDPRPADPVVEEVDLAGQVEPTMPVVFHYVRDDPPASLVVVRPWLLAPAS